jgi:hypothetical protein
MNIPRDAEGRILPGASLNPAGRPKGAVSGRARALELVDQVLADKANIQSLEKALSKALREKPLWFFVNIVMPLLPKETKGVLEAGDRIVEWRGLLSVGAGSSAAASVAGEAGDAGFVHALCSRPQALPPVLSSADTATPVDVTPVPAAGQPPL